MNKLIWAFGFLIVLYAMLVSCSNKPRTQEMVTKWRGKALTLPNDSLKEESLQHKINPLSKKIKILTIINVSCGSCINELNDWLGFMSATDTSKVGFIFLFHSIDNLTTFDEINQSFIHFQYPYFFDREMSIVKKNNLPNEKQYQTFLLDSTNRIVLIGNPNYQKELSRLYQSEIHRLSNSKVETRSGVVLTHEPGRVRLNFGEAVVFQDETGKRLTELEVKKMSKQHDCWLEQKSESIVIIRRRK